MNEYDYIIAGGGGAGLGLAYALLASAGPAPSILLIERETKQQNDRTWCFWGPPSAPFAGIACHSWRRLSIRSEGFERTLELGDWRYWMVRGADYYHHIHQRLEAAPSVRQMQGSLERIQEDGERALVTAGGQTFAARWVFDSTFTPQELRVDTRRYHFLMQHFKGWEIEVDQDRFDPDTATFFDFRTPQCNDLRFVYVLPLSPHRALVEYTLFSADLLTDEEYTAGLTEYLGQVLGLASYRVISEENGIIPMTDQPFARRASRHVLNIGTKGGMVKPSTGFAFARIQRDALAIAASLAQNGNPFDLPRTSPARYRLYDSILLQILYRHGERMKPIFVRLFARNPAQRILRFLDESASPWEDLALIASLPPWPFIRALLKLTFTRQV